MFEKAEREESLCLNMRKGRSEQKKKKETMNPNGPREDWKDQIKNSKRTCERASEERRRRKRTVQVTILPEQSTAHPR